MPEDGIQPQTFSVTGKENRPQLRVPDMPCSGNPAKRLCTSSDFKRDGTSPIQAEKSLSQLRSINSVKCAIQKDNARIYEESPLHISATTGTSLNADTTSSVLVTLDTGKGKNIADSSEGNSDYSPRPQFPRHSARSINSLDVGSVNSISNHGDGKGCVISKGVDSETEKMIEGNRSLGPDLQSTKLNFSACSSTSDSSHLKTSSSESRLTDKRQSNGTIIQTGRKTTHDLDSVDQSRQSGSCSVNEGMKRSRTVGDSLGDHVTPKRKRKFPGPAGILPELGPGRSLDMLSPAAVNTAPSVTNGLPQEDSVILCSQSTDDVFSDTPWQALLKDLAEDGQKLLKKFSISSTLLKAGKRQLVQGKAALIFGVIDSIESHGSEASVTIRDKSGRMQGTIHRDLFKEHETDLQMGTVLVLKQVSIISLSNRNHYLNITPNNVVVLYCGGGQSSLRTLKFHGSQDSLQSVLLALEKKAAAQRNNLNNSGTLTPSSLTGSSGTPQLFAPSPGTRVGNQQLSSPRTPITSHPTSFRTPVPGAVRDVSVVERNCTPAYPRFGNSTPNMNFRQANTSAVNGTMSPQLPTNSTILSTPNTNFKVVPIQNNSDFSRLNPPVNQFSNNFSPASHTGSGTLTSTCNLPVKTNIQQNNQQKQELNTPGMGAKSKWKFKSPPSRNGSIPSSNLTCLAGNTNTGVKGQINNVRATISSTMEHTNLTVSGSGVMQTSIADLTNSKGNGCTSRSWQLNNQTFAQKTVTGTVPKETTNTGMTSAWSFKSSTVSSSGNGEDKKIGQPSNHEQLPDDNLWEDDLSDDLLSQLTEDLT